MISPEPSAPAIEHASILHHNRKRNLLAFWFFGLFNNYGYVIMLSAAHDILNQQQTNTTAVLLADVLPTLIIKLTAPLYFHHIPFGIRILFVIMCQCISYLVVASSTTVFLSLFGVVWASIGSGLGEPTFLSMAAYFDRNVISTWSSGTGGAGVAGALIYALLTDSHLANLSPQTTLYIMLVTPALFAASYWLLMSPPSHLHQAQLLDVKTWLVPAEDTTTVQNFGQEQERLLGNDPDETIDAQLEKNQSVNKLSIVDKLKLIPPLLKFMLPLGLVYFAEYFINQGLHELIYFDHISLSPESQYRWYQVLYQVGVLVSRSSVNCIHFKTYFLPIFAVLQMVNFAIFFTDALYWYIPSVYIVFVLIFYEGLLGGAAYVNTFYQIRQEVKEENVEFSLGVASVADSAGITIAAFASMPVHNWICQQPIY